MFGRNGNAHPNMNPFYPHPQNNGTAFSSYAYQQSNFLNFQFQNQTINHNNYPLIQPSSLSYNIPQPQQPLQAQPNHNQPTQNPNFEQFLQESNQFSAISIASSSKYKYDSNLHVYETVMAIFKQPPYPITIDKMKVFLTYQAKNDITINTLKAYITSLSHYFKENNFENLTLTNDFKKFKSGLQRSFKENSSPFAKTAIKPEFFLKFLEIYDMSDIENVKMMFYMSLSFFGFLRISELLNLKKNDLYYDVETNKLILNIRFSKTDQVGQGYKTYLYNNTHKIYHPLNFIGFVSNLKDDDNIVDISEDLLRKRLTSILEKLEMDSKQFSWHSFRRGGATLASENHIDPAVIKTHGRWQSEAYLLYVDRDQDNAGLQISDVL